jgi:uncharacterized membrane protein
MHSKSKYFKELKQCSVSMKGFLIALSNAWGLFQIIIFLGYGVVALPK